MESPRTESFADALREMVREVLREELSKDLETTEAMVNKYGEQIPYKKASELLNVSSNTVHCMVADGRLTGTPTGVSVRSMAAYIAAGKPRPRDIEMQAERKLVARGYPRFVP